MWNVWVQKMSKADCKAQVICWAEKIQSVPINYLVVCKVAHLTPNTTIFSNFSDLLRLLPHPCSKLVNIIRMVSVVYPTCSWLGLKPSPSKSLCSFNIVVRTALIGPVSDVSSTFSVKLFSFHVFNNSSVQTTSSASGAAPDPPTSPYAERSLVYKCVNGLRKTFTHNHKR